MPSIAAVVYDIGNVLIRWDVRALYRTIFDDEAEIDRFLTEVWRPIDNDRCDRGESFATVIAERVAAHPRDETAIRAAWERWIETIPGPVPGAWELVDDLADAGVPLYGLSNFSAETFPLVRDEYPGFGRFIDIVVSGEHPGLAKPDPAIFELLLDRHDLIPQRTVFVDDTPANVVTARALGLVGLDFVDTTTLRRDLAELGLP